MANTDVTIDQVQKWTPHTAFQVVTVQFGAADTDLDIQHALVPPDPEMVDYIVLQASGAPLVYHDTSPARIPWSNGIVRLRSSVANLKARILLTVSAEPSKFEGGDTSHLSGQYVNVPYNAGLFTTSVGTWGVDLADVVTYQYRLTGKSLLVNFDIVSTDVSTVGAVLQLQIPDGFICNKRVTIPIRVRDKGTLQVGVAQTTPGSSIINLFADIAGGGFQATTGDDTYVQGQIEIEVQ